MILGNFKSEPALSIDNSTIEIKSFLEILVVHIDNKLSFNAYISAIFKKVYAIIGLLRRLKRLVATGCSDVARLEYCSPLLLVMIKGYKILGFHPRDQ